MKVLKSKSQKAFPFSVWGKLKMKSLLLMFFGPGIPQMDQGTFS